TLTAAGASDGALAGKVLIDCTNPGEGERFTLMTGDGHSIAERVRQATNARVVKAFNLCQASVWETVTPTLMIPPRFDGRPRAVPFAGDDGEANDVARALITSLEFEPVEVGPLHRARDLEAMAATVVALLHGGRDPVTVFNLIEPQPAAAAAVTRSRCRGNGGRSLGRHVVRRDTRSVGAVFPYPRPGKPYHR
ncbi:MAG TPA: hypothetical protein VGD16_11980, partial [Enterovirga sp.]